MTTLHEEETKKTDSEEQNTLSYQLKRLGFDPDKGVNQLNEQREAPIHVAVKRRDADAVKFLLNQDKIDLRQQNNERQTPQSLAEKIRNEEIQILIWNKLLEQRKNQQEETRKEKEREKEKYQKQIKEEERVKKVLEEEQAKKVLEEQARKVLEEKQAKKASEEKAALVCHLDRLGFSDADVEDINQVNEQGETPLHLFIKSEATEATSYPYRSLKNLLNHSKINLNATDKEGHTPLYYAITKNQRNIHEVATLLVRGVDISEVLSKSINEKELVLLTIDCLLTHRIEDAKLLLKKIPNIKKGDFGVFTNGIKGLEVVAINSNCDEQIFEKIVNNDRERTFKNSDEMDNFLKFTMAKSFLSLSYSKQSTGFPTFGARDLTLYKLMQSSASKSDNPQINSASKSDNQQINSLIKKITNQEKIELSEGRKIEVIYSNFDGHAAYLVIESDAQENPIKIAYCDGQNRSVKTAEIEKTNLEKLKCEFLEKTNFDIKEWCKTNSPSSFLRKIDGTKNFEDKIPVKPQKRGNCSLKSFNMTLRYVYSRTNPELVFEEKSGSGYEIYKNWKRSLIQAYRDDLNQLATAKDEKGNLLNEDKFWWKDLVHLQTEVLEKEASKKDDKPNSLQQETQKEKEMEREENQKQPEEKEASKKDDKPNSLQPTSVTSLKNASCCTIS
jgi:ankyrin repeat protein